MANIPKFIQVFQSEAYLEGMKTTLQAGECQPCRSPKPTSKE